MVAHEAGFDRVVACLFDDPTVATYNRRLSRLTGELVAGPRDPTS
jgi:hypothetical protein